jgi:class 3 adenylate cyclase
LLPFALVFSLAALAQTAALRGDLESAREAINQAEELPRGRVPPMSVLIALSRAWLAAGTGELARARSLAAEAAQICRQAGHFGLEALALHDVARFGDPVSVAARLQEIAAESDGLLLPTRARHVAALRSQDGVALGQVAETFAGMGAPLLAAEAAMHAALAHRQSGEMASVRTWQLRAGELLSGCEGARPLALPHLDLSEVLTLREREVAGLAAREESSATMSVTGETSLAMGGDSGTSRPTHDLVGGEESLARLSDVARLLTVLFTDIVGSTELAARRGDSNARAIRALHDQLVRQQLAAHGGREVQTTGDGFLVTFGSVGQAVLCACAIQRAQLEHNKRHPDEALSLRLGLHVGEVSPRDDGLFGSAVNLAARVTAKAGPNEALVSEVVKQLAGTIPGVEFRDRGRFRLRGFPERWRLYQLANTRVDSEGQEGDGDFR